MRSARVIFCFFILAAFLLFLPKSVGAQTPTYTPVNPFVVPHMEESVPRNQHTFTQAVTIEVLSAAICQMTGIDPIDPTMGCLTIDPQTRKLGLGKPALDAQGNVELGGMLGTTTDLITFTYQPVVTTGAYTEYLSSNFGIVKKAHAQGYGFEGMRPILKLWETVRNIAYILLTLAFVFVGIGIMLRVKIDPRTVMTIQNQIPKLIIGIILITLSYAMAALMIDLMWVTTYAGINVLSDNFPKPGETLAEKANKNIINNPLRFTNQIFETPKGGVFHITQSVSNNVGELLRDIIKDILGVREGEKCLNIGAGTIIDTITPWDSGGDPLISFRACVGGILAFLASVALKVIILVVLLVTLFKIWFNLLKAYIYTLLYVIVAPVMIAFGLLPTKPMGFENWLRRLFVNVAVFPLTAFLIVAARLLMDAYDDGAKLFVPPLVGNPNAVNFGTLLSFGALLITPHLQTILQEKMGVKGIGSPGLVAAGVAGGAAVVGAPVGRAMKHLNRHDNQGNAVGMLAVGKEKVGENVLGKFAGLGSKYAARRLRERKWLNDPRKRFGGGDGKTFMERKDELKKEYRGMSRTDVRKQAAEAKEGRRADRKQRWAERREDRQKRKNGGGEGESTRVGIVDRIRKRIKLGGSERGSWGIDEKTKAQQVEQQRAKKQVNVGQGGGEPRQGFTGQKGAPSTAPTTVGQGPIELKGPVTATGQIIARGQGLGEAKQNLAREMYNKYKEKSETPAATGQKLDHILADVSHNMEHLATPQQVEGVKEADYTVWFREAEGKHKDKPTT